MAEEKSKTLKVIAIGCGVLVLLIGIAVVVGGIFLKKKVDSIKEDNEHPEEAILKVLGAEQLPDGYYAQVAFSIGMKIGIISNTPKTGERPEFGDNGMIYFSIPLVKVGDRAQGFFSGETDDPAVLRESGINIDTKEIISRDMFSSHGYDIYYVVQRGSVQTDNGNVDGLSAVLFMPCGDKRGIRVAIRYQEDPDPDLAAADLDLSGTYCSKESLENFFSYFNICE